MITRLDSIYRLDDLTRETPLSKILPCREVLEHVLRKGPFTRGQIVTSDLILYTVQNGKSFVSIADAQHNILFKYLDRIENHNYKSGYRQTDFGETLDHFWFNTAETRRLTHTRSIDHDHFYLDSLSTKHVLHADTTLHVKLPDFDSLRNRLYSLNIYADIYSHFNHSQKDFIKRLLGDGREIRKTMRLLRELGIKRMDFELLSPSFIQKDLYHRNLYTSSIGGFGSLVCPVLLSFGSSTMSISMSAGGYFPDSSAYRRGRIEK